MLILIGPSASGKTEVAKILISKYGMQRLVTYTTRKKRVGEIDGRDYHFLTVPEFLKLNAEGEFVETTLYNGNYYGSRKKDVSFEKVVILDPNGLRCYAEKLKGKITAIFLKTPKEVRKERMILRGDDPELIKLRLKKDDEIFQSSKLPLDFIVPNNGIDLETLAIYVYNLYCNHQENK
ncbi:MAG: guanylate kinase [Bacilli bacterium]|jgi:guanylate kinase